MTKKSFGIFYLDTNKAYFYGSNANAMLQVDIPGDVMSYFDISNKDRFYQLIQALVTTNKIEPVPLVMLVAPTASYEKDIAGKVSDDSNADIQQFLDSVPFEKVLSRVYKVQDGAKVVATNKDLYEAVRHGFEKVHFSIMSVAPLSLLQKMIPDIGTTLNLDVIASKVDAIKQYSFITLEEINNPGKPVQQEQEATKPNPMRLYALAGVFAVLLIVLGVMVFYALQPAPKPVTSQQPAPVGVVTSPTPIQSRLTPTSAITPSPTETLKQITPTPQPLPAGKGVAK